MNRNEYIFEREERAFEIRQITEAAVILSAVFVVGFIVGATCGIFLFQ